jgi:hypothetical protein
MGVYLKRPSSVRKACFWRAAWIASVPYLLHEPNAIRVTAAPSASATPLPTHSEIPNGTHVWEVRFSPGEWCFSCGFAIRLRGLACDGV